MKKQFKQNFKNPGNGLDLLAGVGDGSVKCVFFDPQYRGGLDKLAFGNEGKNRGQARAACVQMDKAKITEFIEEINRVLTDDGYLFLWLDKFEMMQGIETRWFKVQDKDKLEVDTDLKVRGLIVWDKQRMGMGFRERNQAEYLVVCQKIKGKGTGNPKTTWTRHNIPSVWPERVKATTHTHTKPIGLQAAVIEAVTKKGDLVIDPAAGGFSVLEACQATGRNFLGTNLSGK